MTPPAFYLHFPDLDALLYEVYAREWADLAETLATTGGGPRDRLRRAVRAYCDYALDSSTRYITLMGMRGQYTPRTGTPGKGTISFIGSRRLLLPEARGWRGRERRCAGVTGQDRKAQVVV